MEDGAVGGRLDLDLAADRVEVLLDEVEAKPGAGVGAAGDEGIEDAVEQVLGMPGPVSATVSSTKFRPRRVTRATVMVIRPAPCMACAAFWHRFSSALAIWLRSPMQVRSAPASSTRSTCSPSCPRRLGDRVANHRADVEGAIGHLLDLGDGGDALRHRHRATGGGCQMGRRLLHDAWVLAAGEQLGVSTDHLGDVAEVVGDTLSEPHHVGRVVDAALGLGLARPRG